MTPFFHKAITELLISPGKVPEENQSVFPVNAVVVPRGLSCNLPLLRKGPFLHLASKPQGHRRCACLAHAEAFSLKAQEGTRIKGVQVLSQEAA